MESTFIMIKPKMVLEGKVGEILTKFERNKFSLDEIKVYSDNKDKICEHYKEHEGKSFYDTLIELTTGQ